MDEEGKTIINLFMKSTFSVLYESFRKMKINKFIKTYQCKYYLLNLN